MFEAVKINTGTFDTGAFSEALVYYNKVRFVGTRGNFVSIVRDFGFENVQRCVELGVLELQFQQQIYGVHTDAKPFEKHRFVATNLVKTERGREINSVYDDLDEIFSRQFGPSADIHRQARWLADNVREHRAPKKLFLDLKADLNNADWRMRSLEAILQELVPDYRSPIPLKFDPIEVGKDIFIVATNLSFSEMNELYHRRIPPSHSTITRAYILSLMFDAKRAAYFGAEDASDMWLDQATANILQAQINSLLNRTNARKRDVELFHELEFEGYAFKEVVNSRQRTPKEVVELLEKQNTINFKKWMASQAEDANLIKEYNKAIVSPAGWTQSSQFKTGKIFVFAGIGTAIDLSVGGAGLGSMAGAALSAAADVVLGSGDEFVLNKILRGWKPNQFIEKTAKEFITSRSIGS